MNHHFAALLDLLFPPRCPACKAPVGEAGALCPSCWAAMQFITAPMCARCGLPFPHAVGEGALCAACIAELPEYEIARAALKYDEASRKDILGLKFHDRTQLVPMFARFLARAGAECLADADAIVPVPLHPFRLLRRQFNQSALLARELSGLTGMPCVPGALRRIRYTPPQTALTRVQRLENVRGAFDVPARMRARVENRKIVLVDDVFTTGATLAACAKALKRAHAGEVRVLTLARTV